MTKIENIKDVARRLKGLRDALELTPESVSETCGIDVETYLSYESGDLDIPVSFVHTLAQKFGVELPAILFGEEPKMNSYFVTRRGKGDSVERTKAYNYQSLSAGFSNKVMNPFMVLVEPDENAKMTLNSHNGQEFNYVVEGSMEIRINKSSITLNTGDSVIFNANLPHGMKALNNKPVKFLAIIS